MNNSKDYHRISVAPMMGYTDRHARYFYRLISSDVVLYTEMITAKALLHGEPAHLLKFDEAEHPLVLQLGGSDPVEMSHAAILAEKAGYDEVNINVGCPSDRVKSGAFGACLMASPGLVGEIYSSIAAQVDIPTTIKHRIGIDDQDSYKDLEHFILTIADAGCRTFIVHARKAWLKGLSPKQNREVPPLDYDRVYRLKQDHPELQIIINGGITTVEQAQIHLNYTDGVMIGREVTNQPWLLAELDEMLNVNEKGVITRAEVQNLYSIYIKDELKKGTSVHSLVKPLFGLFHGIQGARSWRRALTEAAQNRNLYMEKIPELVASYKY